MTAVESAGSSSGMHIIQRNERKNKHKHKHAAGRLSMALIFDLPELGYWSSQQVISVVELPPKFVL